MPWPDVPPSERHQEIDIRAPRADAFQLDQLGVRAFVVHTRDGLEVELAASDRSREPAHVLGLLAGDAGRAQTAFGKRRDAFRGHVTGRRTHARERRASRRERHLLLEDDLHERREARLPSPAWRYAMPL